MSKQTREQWMIAHALAGAVNALNAPFCIGPWETTSEATHDPSYCTNVALELAKLCTPMALEDAIDILNMAIHKPAETPLGED
jgi:hypothetical protein